MAASGNAIVRLRPIFDEDLGAMQEVLERSTDYHELVLGHPPGPAEAQSIYAVLPEGVDSYDAKLVFAVSGDDGAMIGIADVVRDWPSLGTWMIGLLVLVPEARGAGNGARALARIEDSAIEAGAVSMRVAVYRANKRALAFWEHSGYRPIGDSGSADPIVLTKRLPH
jgi:GNAT superfamily N-acetyltransferase